MLRVKPESLDSALTHIIARGDTDILPPAFEYRAILEQWDTIRGLLASQDLDTWATRPVRQYLSPKRGLAFRIATQLDPFDTLLITAVVSEIGADLEAARIPVSDEIVHSYRFAVAPNGQLYRPDFNFESFRRRSITMAEESGGYVLITDIADFFPRIYIHPLENALLTYSKSRDHARAITKMIAGINQHISHGIPVGPSIFRLLAEITINDVDQALRSQGYKFCRFSDDYRIFVPSEADARVACAFLANLLLRHHGLTIQDSKTQIVSADAFIGRFGTNEADAEHAALVESFEALREQLKEQERARLEAEQPDPDPWDLFLGSPAILDEYTVVEYEDLSDEQKEIVDSLNLWQIVRDYVDGTTKDLAFLKFVLRRIRDLRLRDTDDLLLGNVRQLEHVLPDVVQAVAAQDGLTIDERHSIGGRLIQLIDDPFLGHLEYNRAWILNVFAESDLWNSADELIRIYDRFPDQLTRPAVIMALSAAGRDFWFRSRKLDLLSFAPWERRAFLAGARCLPKDEGKHWYRSVMTQLDDLETTVARWGMGRL